MRIDNIQIMQDGSAKIISVQEVDGVLHTTVEHGGKAVAYKREDVLAAEGRSMGWAGAWLTAVAYAWRDDECRKQLLDDPARFLAEHCGYVVPNTVALVVREDPNSQFCYTDAKSWHWELTQNVLILHLPKKPENQQDITVALAAYDTIGVTYPFTLA